MEMQNDIADGFTRIALASFTVDPREIGAAVKFLAGKVTERRNTVPILACLLIEASPAGAVTLTATDLDLMASVTLAADVETPGTFCTPADALADALAKVAKNRDCHSVTITDGEFRAVIKAGRARFNLTRQPVDDFPRLEFAPTDDTGADAALPAQFSVPAARFLADCKALAPCICTEETRYYMAGIALQPRDLGEGEGPRFYAVATDGHNMAVASRELPDGLGDWEGATLPRKSAAVIVAAAKVAGDAETMAIDVDGKNRLRFAFGAVTIIAKSIDGTFPEWPRVWTAGGALNPTEGTGLLFPELAPGAPAAGMEKLAKAAGGAIDWREARQGFVGAVEGDTDLMFGCLRGSLSYSGRKGFEHRLTGHAEAEAFLLARAAELGLPNPGEIEGRCWEIAYHYGEPDNAAYNGGRPFGEAIFHGAKVIERGGRIVGMTVAGTVRTNTWRETVDDWESLAKRTVTHLGGEMPIEGSYSVLMPADGPQLSVAVESYIEGADGYRYPVAMDGWGGDARSIHMSADQVRALIGESCFETLEFPGADGKPRYVARWLWDDGATRFLIVGKDGRAPKKLDAPRQYVTRAEIEAALAGEAWPTVEAAPVEATKAREFECGGNTATVEFNARTGRWIVRGQSALGSSFTSSESDEGAAVGLAEAWVSTAAPEPVQAASEPVAAATPAPDPVDALHGAEIDDTGQSEPEPEPDPLAAILARLDALEAAIAGATLPVESVATPTEAIQRAKRTPAHERAVRRAWAERAARRDAEARRRESIDQAGDLASAWLHATQARRRTVNLALAQRKRRQQAEFAAEARAAETVATSRDLDAARWEIERIGTKRRRNALFARKRTREMVAAVNHMHDRLDAATQRAGVAEAALERLRADLADPSQPERASDLAQLVRERDEARTANAALQDRCLRVEAARDQLAAAVEGMAGRLARAEAAVRRLELAA